MSKYFLRIKCNDQQCKETSSYGYKTRKDFNAAVKRHNGKYLCTRHSGDDLLTLEKLTNSRTYVNKKSEKYPELDNLFWDGSSGFTYGGSWKAFASDFPEGTKIIETVQVILPKEKGQADG